MKKILAIGLALLLTLGLCACSGGGAQSDQSATGTYTLYAMDIDGTAVLAEDLFAGENYITLKTGGSAELCMEDEKATVSWKLDGSKITVSAPDGSWEGTLKNGILTLDFDGSDLYFVGKNASTASLGAISMSELVGGLIDTPTDSDDPTPTDPNEPTPAGPSEVQSLWNGWYYGCLDINGSEGGWESANGLTFDAAMQIELDADGAGMLIIYDPYGAFAVNPEHNNRYVVIDCHADASYLYGDSGTAFDVPINTADWVFVRNLDNPDKLNVGSSNTDADGNKLGYDFTFLPWGDRWESETYQQFIPHFDEYLSKLDEGWTDPFGGEATIGTSEVPPDTPDRGDHSELLGSNPTRLDINDRGVACVYYPADQFAYDDWYGKLKNEATGVGILLDPMLGATNFDELKQSYEENNSDEDDYSLTETTINGYRALVMTYSDWLGATMRVDIDFGGNHDGWYGISFAVSGDTLADCDTDLVWAIIESLELLK